MTAAALNVGTLLTGDIGVANLRFHDNSNLSVGPKSSVRLDKFVYESGNLLAKKTVEAAREAVSDLLLARRVKGPTRSRHLTAPLAYAAET